MNINASLVQHRNSYYVVLTYFDKIANKRKQKWVPTKIPLKGNNKRLANQKLEEIRANYTNYIPTENIFESQDSKKYIEIYLQEWLESYKNRVEENTYYSYRLLVNKMVNYYTGMNIMLKDFKPAHIQKLYDFLFSEGLCGNSVLHYHSVLRKALATAVKLDIIPSNPADKVERPKKNQFIGDFYSVEELHKLYEASKGDPLELVILLASFYGLRRSEVLRNPI